jgi:acyl-CoA thioesterase-1
VSATPAIAQTAPARPASNTAPTILVVGDSLSAEYGIARDSGWVKLLEKRLQDNQFDFRVVNASISGDTTSGGVARTPAALAQHTPDIFILELGANDALRGLSLAIVKQNLSTMLQAANAVGARSLVIGMQMPSNFDQAYTNQFKQMFADVARTHKARLVPFFFETIALDQRYFQDDGLHPNEAAQEKLLNHIWPVLEPMLSSPD